MSDLCFLCRGNTDIGMCTKCSLKAHYKCWAQFLKHVATNRHVPSAYSIGVKCPQCKQMINKRGPVTRSMTKNDDKETVVYIIKNYLNIVEETSGTDYKKNIVIELFEYIFKNMWFLKENNKFQKCVQNKLIEFHLEDNWEYAAEIYNRMFGVQIPQKYF